MPYRPTHYRRLNNNSIAPTYTGAPAGQKGGAILLSLNFLWLLSLFQDKESDNHSFKKKVENRPNKPLISKSQLSRLPPRHQCKSLKNNPLPKKHQPFARWRLSIIRWRLPIFNGRLAIIQRRQPICNRRRHRVPWRRFITGWHQAITHRRRLILSSETTCIHRRPAISHWRRVIFHRHLYLLPQRMGLLQHLLRKLHRNLRPHFRIMFYQGNIGIEAFAVGMIGDVL